ncbi:hypothetical protein [Marinilactibacillus kalidii]|uniref:hypothetical protein n=1 Tax=Marinilactibacillus kalidii TaxID=2820274 RepID=UPI001ABE76F7|nr:hypothetical protein [Marinilactibacillus kalidii]
MVIQNQLLQKKKTLLLNLYNTYESFNQTLESAVDVLAEVELLITDINALDDQLSDEEISNFSVNYRDVWVEIVNKHRELLKLIEKENQTVKKQMDQVNKKNQMINGYMDQNESMFLDRQA